VPVSNGFGRRFRYLVWDGHNGKLISIIAIGDPVFNLSVRDNLIKWDVKCRGQRLVNEYFQPIGYTGGWGHFHIPDALFMELRDYLRDMGHHYADRHRFGQGPNWRMRTTRAALEIR
jgi:hypothetical protein